MSQLYKFTSFIRTIVKDRFPYKFLITGKIKEDRMVAVGRNLRKSSGPSLAQAEPLRASCPGPCTVRFYTPPKR